jgi:glyceraldehyde 3-phosphate dehydrogenase
MSMIPTTTGAARAVGEVLPELNGKLDGMAIRVPTSNVSIVDLVADLKKTPSESEINTAIRAAADGPLKDILSYSDEPMVSIDFNGSPFSSTVDLALTKVLAGGMVKVLSWYDNEWGFSNRMVDVTKLVAA